LRPWDVDAVKQDFDFLTGCEFLGFGCAGFASSEMRHRVGVSIGDYVQSNTSDHDRQDKENQPAFELLLHASEEFIRSRIGRLEARPYFGTAFVAGALVPV